MRRFVTLLAFPLLASGLAWSQNFTTAPCPEGDGSSGHGWFFNSGSRACEVRRATLPLRSGHLGVDGQNGGIEVVGEDRSDIALEVKVTAQAPSREDAESLLHQVHIVTGGNIHAEGPDENGGHNRSWSASYRLRVPRRVAATELRTTNGGITVTDLAGDLQAKSNNGGLSLHNLSGSVRAETTNGGVSITLAGNHWQGKGLFARTTNGGIALKVPADFAAHLVASTTNGGVAVAFPLPDSDTRHRTHVDANINGGGPPVQLETTNGGVSINRL